ncbi:MAG: hypothetical protein QGD94_04515 [Planctomycetia bacterium]|nr:hypothetical protein [Planctomycetia bacterium]
MASRHAQMNMPGKLNLFQRTMLLYDEIHPYNAVHVVEVSRRLDAERLRGTIKDALEGRGLTGLRVNRRRKRYGYGGGPAEVELKLLDEAGTAAEVLPREVREQINTPFARGEELNPFRFFALAEGESFHLGLVYCHFIAGGISIASLLRDIVQGYVEGQVPPRRLELYPRTFWKLLGVVLERGIQWAIHVPAVMSAFMKSCKAGYRDPADMTNGFAQFGIERADFDALRAASRRWGVTLNDVFLAMLLKSLFPYALRRVRRPSRRDATVGSIVDLRRDLRVGGPEVFGVFLSSFVVSHKVSPGAPLERVAKKIHRQTERIKKDRLYFGTAVEQSLALFLAHFLSLQERGELYRHNYPLWGGITNMNLDAVWKLGGVAQHYLRGVSTGPTCPIVLSFTTLGGRVEVGISHRTTVFGPRDVKRIIRDIRRSISGLGRGQP